MALIDEQQPESGFGLSLFKSAKQAYKEDVAPRAQADDPYAAFRDTGPALAQAGQDDPYAAFRESSAPAKPTSVSSSNFGRGWDVSGKQLKQTAYGTAALIGDTFGSDSLKKWGLQGYKDAEKEIQAISKESDSFTSAVQSGDIGSWLTYSAGYLAGQFADIAVASAAGAVVGGSLSGPAAPAGAAAGAVTGAINKAAVQTGLRGAVGKMIDKEAASLTATYIERGMVKEAAEKAAAEQAVKSVYRTIGATTANTFLNATGELGSIYGDAVEEAAKTGQEYSLGKIWLSGIAATAVDTWADSKAVKGLTDAFKGKSRVGSIAMEAFKGGMREGLTEGTQTVIERWGADKDLTSKEAFKEYIDSAAVGVLGGAAAGGASGAVSKLQGSPGKTEVDQTQANFTKLPESQSGRTRPLDEADTPGMLDEEFNATAKNGGFMAALYQQADEQGRKRIMRAVEEVGAESAFIKAMGSQGEGMLEYGRSAIASEPEFVQRFLGEIDARFGAPTNLDPKELLETFPEVAAHLYTTGSKETRQIVRQAVERAGVIEPFQAALADPDALEAGAKRLESLGVDPMPMLGEFANTQSPAGVFKFDRRNKPVRQALPAEQEDKQRAESEGFTLDEPPAPRTPREQIASMAMDSLPPDWESSKEPNKYGILSHHEPFTMEKDRHQYLYSHKALPNLFFPSENAVFEALRIRKQAKADGTWDPKPTTPAQGEGDQFDQSAASQGFTLKEPPKKPDAPSDVGVDDLPDDTGLPKDIRGVKMTEKNRPLLDAYFTDEIAALQKKQDGKGKTERLAQLERQALRVGFSQADVDQMFGRQQAAAQTRLTEPKVTRNSPPADPNATWSPTVTLDYGDYTIENDGASAVYDMKAPVELSSTAKLTGLVANPKRLTLVTQNASGQNFKVRVQGDHIRLEKLETAQSRDYEFDGSNSADLDRILGSELMSRLDKAKPEERVGMVLEAVTQKLGLDNLDRFSAEFDNMRQGRPASTSAKPEDKPATKADSQQAADNLKDAAANLFDVLTDVTGAKQNITGQRRTVAELPAALTQVMTALGKLGVVKFRDVVRETMKRMRISQNGWAQMVDKVTPRMLREAYNRAQIDGKESPDAVAAVTTNELRLEVKGDQSDPVAIEVSQVEAKIEAENKRLTAKYGKVDDKGRPLDWTKASFKPSEVDVAEFDRDVEPLMKLKDRLKELTDQQREESKFAKPRFERPDPKEDEDSEKTGAFRSVQETGGEQKAKRPPKPVQKQLPPSEMTPAMRALIGTLKKDDQTRMLKEWGSLTPEALEKLKGDVDRWYERVQKRSTAEGRAQAFRRKLEKILSLYNDQQGARDTLTALNQRVDEIDKKLRDLNFIEDKGKVYQAVNEADENAYLWGDQGFRIGKNLPADQLLAIRRSLMDDIREVRARNLSGGARLIRRNAQRIEIELSQALSEELKSLPAASTSFNTISEAMAPRNDERAQIQAVYDDAKERITTIIGRLDRPAKDAGPIELPEMVVEEADLQVSADVAVHNLLMDLRDGKIKASEAFAYFSRGLRDGSFQHEDLVRGIRVMGLDVPAEAIAETTNLAMKTRMLDHVRQSGFSMYARDRWLLEMDRAVRSMRKRDAYDSSIFTDAELAAYEEWSTLREDIALRRKEDFVLMSSMDPVNAFRGMLFIDHRLQEMRNPDLIQDQRKRLALKGTISNLQEAWFGDVYTALRMRPELESALLDPEDGILPPTEVEAYKGWLERKKAAVEKEAELTARTPYFLELAGLDSHLARLQGRTPDALSRAADTDQEQSRQQIYEGVYRAIARAKANELEMVMRHARELYFMTRERMAGSTQYDSMIDEYLEMVAADDQSRGGVSVEDFADQYIEAEKVDVDGFAGPSLSDEDDSMIDVDQGVDDEGNPSEVRFLRGPVATGVTPTTTVVAQVASLTAGWKNAPHIEVLQNVMQLPEPLRSQVLAKLGDSAAKGLYHNGTVYLFADHIGSLADTEFTLFHEAYGHLGMRAVLGEKFDQFLETAYRTRPEVREAADALIADGMPKLEAIDEVLSDMAGANRNVSIAKQWVGKIISGLREIGLARVADWFASMTDAEVASTLAAARDAVRNGTLPAMNGAPSEIRFKEVRPPYEVFATKGGKTTGYARYNPVTDSWAVFSADGANIKDGYTTTTTQDFHDVVQAMKHRGKVEYRLRSGLFVDDKIVADLVELPQFNDTKKHSLWDPRRWAQIRRTAQIQFQNEYLPVFEVIEYLESKGRITPETDVKTALMLYERRAGYLVEDFRKRYAQPIQKLVEQAGKLGVTKKDIDRYLTARHAFERNAVIASINPEMPDGGSGLTNQQADDILRAVRSSPAAQVLEEIGRLTDKMGQEKVNYLSQTGMITKKLAEKLRGYDHYVNLSGEAGAELDADDPGLLAGGSKFNVKGKERRALGRGEGNEASDVLSRTIQSYEAALIRGQKNEVAKKVLALIETNYSSEFAVVNRQAFRKQFNPETGEVEEVLDENYMARKDVMVAKVGGIPTTIEFKERGLGTFADAIHGMVSPAQSGPIMESVGKVSRFLGSLMTTYNPVFTVVNFVRDAQTMYLNAASDGKISKQMARDMVKALPSAIRAAIHEASGYRYERGQRTEAAEAMAKMLAEMQREGGITYFADRKSLEDQVKKLDDLLSGKKYPMQETFQKIGSVMEFLADVSEMAPRLAAYKVVRENGFSKEQAAVFSGDITVNFNMRGANKEVRQLYVFFNPAVQGSYKLVKLATTKEGQKQFLKMAAAMAAFGFLTSLLGRALSGEDDDGIDKLDKVPVYKRATSVVLAADVPGGAPLPIPYGWNAFFSIGVFGADAIFGHQPVGVSASRIVKTAAEAFSPIGSGASDAKSFETFMAKFVAPTSLLPGVEFLANENRFGAPIRKEQSPFDASKTPDAQQYFRSVSPISRAITDGLTSVTGGNRYKAGGIDVNPATIDFLIQSYLPGLPSDAYKGAGAAITAASGEQVKRVPWPLLDRFSARIPTGYDAGAYRRAAEMVETVYQEYSKTRDQGRRQEIRAEYPRIGYAHAVIASTTQELRQVRKQIADLETRPMSDDARVQRKNQLMDREEVIFKKATKKLMEAGDPIREAMMANE